MLEAKLMNQLLATDLDGTILGRDQVFNQSDIDVLKQLGMRGVTRVIATGRTLNSALEVMPSDFPIDYLVFSSGAGVYNWKKRQIMKTLHLDFQSTMKVLNLYKDYGIEHTLHFPIPDNHRFLYSIEQHEHPDFLRYIELHGPNARPMNKELTDQNYTQTLAFIPHMPLFDEIKQLIPEVKTVRATSPIDGKSIWMECFHPQVSKANGIRYVCDFAGIDLGNVTAIGNDYNDLDMLNAYSDTYVVKNAPEELRKQFAQLVSVNEAPLADWYQKVFLKNIN